jgi:hypothetical protein
VDSQSVKTTGKTRPTSPLGAAPLDHRSATRVNRGKRKAENEPALRDFRTIALRKVSFAPAD